jgi:uncharacterized protein (TIGR03083 family)
VTDDAQPWIDAIRRSHDRFSAAVAGLEPQQVHASSYDADWSIADVASHLGSQAEIFGRFLDAGLNGDEPPGPDDFGPIWDEWNGRSPEQQVADSVSANERFVAALEALSAEQREGFGLTVFGSDTDLAGMLGMRLGEHAVHTWDVEVALDPAAVVAHDAVELLLDGMPKMAARVGKPAHDERTIAVHTTAPERHLVLRVGPEGVRLHATDDRADDRAEQPSAQLLMPAEAFLRLVYGRLDSGHTPPHSGEDASLLAELRTVFPGF